jgi:hypothetical protein
VTDPEARLTLLKRPREATDPYLAAARAGFDTPEFPEIYFEAFPWRTAGLQCRFFQSIADEGASTVSPGGQRLLRRVGALCGMPAHGLVLEMHLTGTQPDATDNYRDLNTDAETVFEGLTVDEPRISP